jgi:type IV pilus biogenesis protein CpaD/CtpE
MNIVIPNSLFKHGQDAMRMAASIAQQTGGILVAGNRALTVRLARNEREAATVVRLRVVVAHDLDSAPEAA